jgi:hypothetical protein
MLTGAYIEDAIRNITGGIFSEKFLSSNGLNSYGAFYTVPEPNVRPAVTASEGTSHYLVFDASRRVPTASENRPASISAYLCIKY